MFKKRFSYLNLIVIAMVCGLSWNLILPKYETKHEVIQEEYCEGCEEIEMFYCVDKDGLPVISEPVLRELIETYGVETVKERITLQIMALAVYLDINIENVIDKEQQENEEAKTRTDFTSEIPT